MSRPGALRSCSAEVEAGRRGEVWGGGAGASAAVDGAEVAALRGALRPCEGVNPRLRSGGLADVPADNALPGWASRRLAFFLGGPLANLAATVPPFAALNALDRGASLYNLAVAPFGLLAEPGSMSGVVGIVMEGARLAEGGMALELAISLSISLAVLNLLPIPVLDGGQILLACMERVFPRLVRLRVAATLVGAAMVAGVTLYANVQDALRYWG
ncbi:MAG TPA: site-2 protease family protein [Thermoanaerobaculia bacterium]|nr:site-2 protease family protein [Thermoanaerobaculia bacterium]